MTKVRVAISEIETRKTIEKVNKIKSLFFWSFFVFVCCCFCKGKIEKPLARLKTGDSSK